MWFPQGLSSFDYSMEIIAIGHQQMISCGPPSWTGAGCFIT